jgi:hypothetical protein
MRKKKTGWSSCSSADDLFSPSTMMRGFDDQMMRGSIMWRLFHQDPIIPIPTI